MAKKNKTLPGPCKDVREGHTEHGGCVTVTYYFDSHYKPIPKEQATRAIVHEYDEKERSVFRDYLTLDKGRVLQARRQDGQPDGMDDVQAGEVLVKEEMVIREVRIEDEAVVEIQLEEIFIEEAVNDAPENNDE